MIQAYFEDMEKLLAALTVRAKSGALLKIAVATSAYGGIVIPVDFILAEIAEQSGWELQDVQVVRRLRSSAQLHHKPLGMEESSSESLTRQFKTHICFRARRSLMQAVQLAAYGDPLCVRPASVFALRGLSRLFPRTKASTANFSGSPESIT